MNFLELFSVKKPIIGMLHLKGRSRSDVLNRAIQEINIYKKYGVDGVIVENYFGNEDNMRDVLEYLQEERKMVFGLNYLEHTFQAFQMAQEYKVKFIQIDSVAGHLIPAEDKCFAEDLNERRKNSTISVLGGVWFKYQPYHSGRSLQEDLALGLKRCDGIVVTQDRTGQETDIQKIKKYRQIIGEQVPLIIGAGMTVDNAAQQLIIADGAIVGSFFKQDHVAQNDVCEENVSELMQAVDCLRRKLK